MQRKACTETPESMHSMTVQCALIHRYLQGLNFLINQEKYLKVFLEDGDVPIDNSTSERTIQCQARGLTFTHNLQVK